MKIVLATGNPGKLAEIQSLLSDSDYEIAAQSEFGVSGVIENGVDFVENALIKARHASLHTGLGAIADDSGLAVDYLDGRPGVHSARYAGESATDQDNIAKLLDALEGVDAQLRGAQFHCVIAMVRSADDPVPLICRGTWRGHIAETPCGGNGFGYDPVFYIDELGCTSAELSPAIKNRHSHRGKALLQLRKQLI